MFDILKPKCLWESLSFSSTFKCQALLDFEILPDGVGGGIVEDGVGEIVVGGRVVGG